ncbi:MAG: hypothetical protein MJA29_02905 [Candidatus Omnitrophica bacterium]|nr:hypothetical protein [Candidatus Omnitrophota bacterium]
MVAGDRLHTVYYPPFRGKSSGIAAFFLDYFVQNFFREFYLLVHAGMANILTGPLSIVPGPFLENLILRE